MWRDLAANRRRAQAGGLYALVVLGLMGCAETTQGTATGRDVAFHPGYQGISTQLLDEDLVNFHIEMTGARDNADVAAYGECAAARYALIRGYGFARHVRTTVYKEGGLWRGDAVYTVSPTLPEGLQTLDAEVVVAACTENGIPTV